MAVYLALLMNGLFWNVQFSVSLASWQIQDIIRQYPFISLSFFLVPAICQLLLLLDSGMFKTGVLPSFPFFLYKIFVFICMVSMLILVALMLTPYDMADRVLDFWLFVHVAVSGRWGHSIFVWHEYYIDTFTAVATVVFAVLTMLYFRSVFKVMNNIRLGTKANTDAYILMERNAKKLAVYTVLMGLFCASGVFGFDRGIFLFPLASIIGSIPLVIAVYRFDKSLRSVRN